MLLFGHFSNFLAILLFKVPVLARKLDVCIYYGLCDLLNSAQRLYSSFKSEKGYVILDAFGKWLLWNGRIDGTLDGIHLRDELFNSYWNHINAFTAHIYPASIALIVEETLRRWIVRFTKHLNNITNNSEEDRDSTLFYHVYLYRSWLHFRGMDFFIFHTCRCQH